MGVEFEEGSIGGVNNSRLMYSRFQPSDKKPRLVSWLLKIGIIKKESQAIYVLITFCVICIIASVYIYHAGNTTDEIIIDYSRFNTN